MEQDTEYFADPGKKYLKRLKVEEDKRNPNEYLGDAYLGDVSTVSKKPILYVETLNTWTAIVSLF